MRNEIWFSRHKHFQSLGISKNKSRSLCWQCLKTDRDLVTFKNAPLDYTVKALANSLLKQFSQIPVGGC